VTSGDSKSPLGGWRNHSMSRSKYDFYRNKTEPGERMATLPGAGLPDHVDPSDWEPMLAEAGIYDDDEDMAADIEVRGFSYFKLVEWRPPDDAA
jgi:hypothetical protein